MSFFKFLFILGSIGFRFGERFGRNITVNRDTVTLKLTLGFSFGRPVLYLSTDSSSPLAAALEEATYAPKLGSITTGHDDSASSAIERIFAFVNGPTGKDNPQRQGFNSALIDGLSPTEYSRWHTYCCY